MTQNKVVLSTRRALSTIQRVATLNAHTNVEPGRTSTNVELSEKRLKPWLDFEGYTMEGPGLLAMPTPTLYF